MIVGIIILGVIFWIIIIFLLIKLFSKGKDYTDSVIEKNKAIKDDIKANTKTKIAKLEQELKELKEKE